MTAITDLIRPSRATRKVETLMVLSPLTTSLPKLLLKPGRWTVGSAATCSYRIVAEGVRPRHALLLCGGQTALLKAWDSHTWHNGQPVRGEVRLQAGDRVTVGSVEFSVEPAGPFEVLAQLPDAPRDVVARAQSAITTPPEPDGWDLERLRGQIQNLRDELSQRVSRRTTAIPAAPSPIAETHPDVERMSARVAELEQSADEARQLAKQTQQELSALRAEQAQRNAEWQQAREQLLAENAERERAWQQQADAWAVEHEQWQDELLTLANARQQLATKLEQRQSELQTEATRWQTEYETLRADRQQQVVTEVSEREQWQQEVESLTNARQQLAAEFEQRQSELKTTATRWQTKCEALHADWQRQQAAWAEERTQLLEESQRQKDDAAQQAATQREQEWADQSQQLLAERQQIEAERQQIEAERARIEAERQQLQAARLDSEQALAELSAERQRVADCATEVLSKSEEHARRMAEVEQQQAQLIRDQQVLEHSRNWVQSDRRKLVEEKTEWQQQCAERQSEREGWEAEREQQRLLRDEFEKARELMRVERDATQQLVAEREQLTAEREQFAAERAAWTQQRAESETEQQAHATQLETAYAELQTQQQTLHDEQDQLQTLRADWDARAAEVQIERQAADPEPQTISEDRRAWEDDRTAWNTDLPTQRDHQRARAEEPLQSLTDDWSIGVDLTAPRETPGTEPLFEPAAVSDWPTNSMTHSLTEATSLDQVSDSEASAPAAEWEILSPAGELNDFVNAEVPHTLASESPPEKATDRPWSVMETLDDDVAALRAELAEKFHLPGLRETLTETSIDTEPAAGEPIASEQVVDETVADEPVVVESSVVEPVGDEPVVPPNSGSPVNILGSLAFSDDEPVDDSVSRYMQHLLARSQRPSENGGERYVPASTHKSPGTEPTRLTSGASPISVTEIEITSESDSSGAESPSSAKLRAMQAEPAHKQDKDAIRAATEKMRQVANQQTFNNVRASNSIRLKRSLKMKSSLAVFSFVLSAGLLSLGYSYQPDFLVLGVCAAGLGVMTWVDLFIAIREARRRTSQLSGRKKKA